MPEEALQAAFEIKTTCDEISRKLLRWHWEQKPGSHSLDSLLEHIRTRQQESPDYYDRLPDLSGRTSWQQLDTTLCMRVLLDPEKDAARPLDLLGNTAHPAAARRACNAVRAARNEAAHASDRTAATQAAILFNEAVEALEEGYAGTALRTADLSSYYRTAEDYLDRCGARKPIASARAEEEPERPSKTGKSSTNNTNRKTSGGTKRAANNMRNGGARSAANGSRNSGAKGAANGSRNGGAKRAATRAEARKRQKRLNRKVVLVLLALLVIGLLLRGFAMNWQ